MDLGAALGLFRRRALAILLALAIGISAAFFVTNTTHKQYRASTRLFVSLPGTRTPAEILQGFQVSSQLLQSYAEIATSRNVATQVKQRLSLPESVDAVKGKLSAAPEPETLFIVVRATDGDPVRARSLADAAANALIDAIAALEKGRDTSTAIQAQVIDAAVTPRLPIAPRPNYNLAVGALAGLIGGLLIALALDALDRSVKTAVQAQQLLQAPALGSVPRFKKGRAQIVAELDPKDAVGEAYRALRTATRFVNPDDPLQAFAITSPSAGEGKTTTAANLAIALAQSGERVVLVDADLRRAGLAQALGIEGAVGLTNVITREVSLDDALQEWGGLLAVLPAGSLPPNPSEIVGSQSMTAVIDELRSRFDVIVVDTPPVLPVTDAVVMATQVDGIIVVARVGRTSRSSLVAARHRIETVQAHLVGCVLNASTSTTEAYYGEYRAESPVHAAT